MRRKTSDGNLAKRAKKLVKKWHNLVNEHLQSLNRTSQTTNGNSIKSEPCNRPVSFNVDRRGTVGRKRKVVCDMGSGPPCEKISRPSSTGRVISNDSFPTSVESEEVVIDANNEVNTNDGVGLNNGSVVNELSASSDKSSNSSFEVDKPSDTRVQEDRLTNKFKNIPVELLSLRSDSDCLNGGIENISMDAVKCYNAIDTSEHKECNSLDSLQCSNLKSNVGCSEIDVNVRLKSEIDVNVNSDSKCFDIEAEDLEVHRRDIPSNTNCPSIEFDGVNGTYGDLGTWHSWLDPMPCCSRDLVIFPYVIFD